MRIIAGEFSSRRLETLSGDATRPTLDKVKEAVFSMLGGYFDGGTVLDLYAGSGAVGLEAISRGNDFAFLVDKSKPACDVIKKNVQSLKCEDRTKVLCMKDTVALEKLYEDGLQFDLVYLDPPYKAAHHDDILTYLNDHHMMKKNGYIVIESLKQETYQKDYSSIHFVKEKVYGIMKITIYKADK